MRRRAFEQDRDRHDDTCIDDDRRQRVRQEISPKMRLCVPVGPACGRAWTNSRFLSDRNSGPREPRPARGQETMPMAIVTVVMVEGRRPRPGLEAGGSSARI